MDISYIAQITCEEFNIDPKTVGLDKPSRKDIFLGYVFNLFKNLSILFACSILVYGFYKIMILIALIQGVDLR